jgi:hypothetical protein
MVEANIPRYYTLEEKEYVAPYYNVRTDYKKFHSANTPIVIDNGMNYPLLCLICY